jgi:hypothetical protein
MVEANPKNNSKKGETDPPEKIMKIYNTYTRPTPPSLRKKRKCLKGLLEREIV